MPLFDIIIACQDIQQPTPILLVIRRKFDKKPVNSFAFLLKNSNLTIGDISIEGDEDIQVFCPIKEICISVKLRKIDHLRKLKRNIFKRNPNKNSSKKAKKMPIMQISLNKACKKSPKISIIIPNKDNLRLLNNAIKGLFFNSNYQNLELIIVDNNSKDNELHEFYKSLERYDNIKIIEFKEDFNFSRANNIGRKNASGEILIFANNDLEVINLNYIQRLIDNFETDSNAIYGAKLLYSDNSVQHAGIALGMGGLCGHYGRGLDFTFIDKFNLLNEKREVSAVTGAFLAIKAEYFDKLNGFDEEYIIEFSDVDLCLRASKAKTKIIFDPELLFYHYEGSTRNIARSSDLTIIRDRIRFFEMWGDSLLLDKFYPVSLSRENETIGFMD